MNFFKKNLPIYFYLIILFIPFTSYSYNYYLEDLDITVTEEKRLKIQLGGEFDTKKNYIELELEISHNNPESIALYLESQNNQVIPLELNPQEKNKYFFSFQKNSKLKLDNLTYMPNWFLVLKVRGKNSYAKVSKINFLINHKNEVNEEPPSCEKMWKNFKNNENESDFYNLIMDSCEDSIATDLRDLINSNYHLDYERAKTLLYTSIDFYEGEFCGIYTSLCNENRSSKFNCEHIWPQSKGARGKRKSDLHNIFVSDSNTNSKRGNYPFCNVAQIKWSKNGNHLGLSKNGKFLCFEPKDTVKGNVARAMFYFSLRYNMKIDHLQEKTLREWHELDPVDEKELIRNDRVYLLQNNRNPFIDLPEIVPFIRDF